MPEKSSRPKMRSTLSECADNVWYSIEKKRHKMALNGEFGKKNENQYLIFIQNQPFPDIKNREMIDFSSKEATNWL